MKTANAKVVQRDWLALGLASAGLGICTMLAASGEISASETALLNFIYDLPGPFTQFMYVVTQAGSIGAMLAVVITAFVLKRRKLAGLLLTNSVIAYALVAGLKELIARPRPAEVLPAIVVRLEYANGFGFPSGHTAIATVMALTLMPYTAKRYQWLLWLWITGVGFSRLYLGVHAPLDVVGGFCVGVLVASAARLVGTQLIVRKRR